MTESELKLWKVLARKQLGGLRFRRQHPIGRYIADFYCHAKKLVVEVDGGIHIKRKKYDKNRDESLRAKGNTILRIQNREVEHNLERAKSRILEAANG